MRLKEGVIYSVNNFTVLPNKDEFRVMRYADFMLEFDSDTIVRKSFVKSDGFTRYPFQLVEIDTLEPTNKKYLIDLASYVTNVGRTTEKKTGSKTLDFYLANCRGQQIKVTLWGCLSDMLIEKKTHHVGLYPVVITAMSVKLYINRLYLSSTSLTLIVDDEKIPVLKRLKTDDSGVEFTKEIMPTDNTTTKPETLENLLMWARNQKYDSRTFLCEVKIDKVRKKKGWNYPLREGEKCKKGILDRKEGRFWCDSCNSSVEYPVVVVMFDETVISLLKCSTSSILDSEGQDEEEHSNFPPALANIVGTSHTLDLNSNKYYEHKTYESFTCWKVVTGE
ncbi:reverse transcriptase domain-containing protein, partial [Tanacetum coccineum]